MNNKYKNLLYLLSLAIMTAVFSGCDRSDDVKPATAQVIRANVTAEDIPEVTSSLLNQLGLRKGGQGFSVYTEGQELGIEIDWNRIKQLIDTTGKQTYTLAVKDKDNDPKTFYNLIFQLTPDNEPYKPYLLKYSMDDDFAAAYYSGEANFGNFKGTVQKIILHNIANRSSTENIFSDDGEKTVAADDCPNTTQFNGSNGGGNSGGGSNTGTLPDDEAQWQCEVFIQETDWYDCLTPDCSVKVYDETTYVITYENCQLVSAMSTPTDDDSCKQKDDELPIIEPEMAATLWERGICETETFKNNECLQAVWSTLKETDLAYKNLTDFITSEPFAELCFDVQDTITGLSNAKTIIRGTLAEPKFTIAMNKNRLNKTKLELARTILHETIHAELGAIIIKAEQVGGFEAYLKKNPNEERFVALWNFINDNQDIFSEYLQHNYMVESYLLSLSESLRELSSYLLSDSFKNQFYQGRKISYNSGENMEWDWEEFYLALAYVGLHETDAYKSIDDKMKVRYGVYRSILKKYENEYKCN